MSIFAGISKNNTTTKTSPIKPVAQKTGIFEGLPKKQTQPVQSITMPAVETSTNVTATTTPIIKPATPKLKTLPSGGQYLKMDDDSLTTTPRKYGSLDPQPGKERDHIIPVSLGGTSNDPNLEYLKSEQSWLDKALNRPASLKNRQEGKVLVEWKTIKDYQDGKISLNEARQRVLNWNNQPEATYKIYAKEFLKSPATLIKKAGNLFAGLANKPVNLGDFRPFSEEEKAQEQKMQTDTGEALKNVREATVDPVVEFAAAAASKPKTTQAFLSGNLVKAAVTGATEEPGKVSVNIGEKKITGLGENELIKGISEQLNKVTSKFGVSPERTQRLVETTALPVLALFADPGISGPTKATKEILEKALKELGEKQVKQVLAKEGEQGLERLLAEKFKSVVPEAKATKAAAPLADEAKKYKSAEEFVAYYSKNPNEIPTTPEYQKYLQEKDAFIKRENEIYSEMKLMRDKYAGKTINDVPPEDISKYENLQKELHQSLSKKTLAKIPEGDIKTHIGEKGLKSQLTDIWNQAQKQAPSKPPIIDDEIPFESVNPDRAPAKTKGTIPKEDTILTNKKMVDQGLRDLSAKTKEKTALKSRKVSNVSYSDSVTKPNLSQEEARGAVTINDLNDPTLEITKKFTTPTKILDSAEKYKDISGFKANARDVYRNFKKVFGDKYNDIKNSLLDPFDAAKGKYIDYQKKLLDELDTKIVKGFGIKKGSKESAAVMDYGEGLMKEGDLVSSFGTEKAKKVKEAAEWFRQRYDTLLDEVNAVRAEIYPTNPDKVIPKRKDYFRHFEELSTGLGALKNIFENPAGISPKLAGVSDFTTPRAKWLPFAQRRVAKDSTRDAVGGFLNYVPSASYAINIDPYIGKFRRLGRELAEKTEGTKNINNFIEYLNDFANDLSGKSNAADRYIQKVIPGGRKAFQVINWLNNRVKANAILGNISSSIAQIFNVPQGIASAKQYSIPGATKTLAQVFQPNDAMKLSSFIKERYSSSMYNKFDTGILANTKKFAAWMVGVMDEIGTKFIWNSHYEKALAEKIPNPVKYADDITRSLVAGRGIGEVPLIQKSKLFQFAAPFQLEVGNLWYVMGDMVKRKDFAGLATLFVANYLMNRVAEDVRGSDVTFDPINALIQGFQNQAKDEGVLGKGIKVAGRLGGEILSNIPLGQTAAGFYPEEGVKLPGVGKLTRKEFFGAGDPTRTGSGLLAAKGLSDPLFKILPGFAGGQIKKTYQGAEALIDGVQESNKGVPLFDVAVTPENIARATAFGPYATEEGQQYSEAQEQMNSLKAAKTRKDQQEMERIRPIYDKAWEAHQQGNKEEAARIWNELNEEEKAVFDKLKNAAKKARNDVEDKKMFNLVKQLYELRDNGREEEAMRIWHELSEEEKKIFKRTKKTYGY